MSSRRVINPEGLKGKPCLALNFGNQFYKMISLVVETFFIEDRS
jgi:hypothetical protein